MTWVGSKRRACDIIISVPSQKKVASLVTFIRRGGYFQTKGTDPVGLQSWFNDQFLVCLMALIDMIWRFRDDVSVHGNLLDCHGRIDITASIFRNAAMLFRLQTSLYNDERNSKMIKSIKRMGEWMYRSTYS
jgi:hypothetical protein